ncbi:MULTISPECIES: PTS mannose/fructose/sorbose transporter subunit IIC [unclassified Lactococcus]|uniref:PTS mannose/fructose/sorbose transporter subunit IIC n=1 Tax=unclassified Lactococcus TaxID=2643510 RepID=UPI001430BF6C|nr:MULTISPECIES: PTS mannose/fructose/sorbose transporter subunit IIC [unclassified Lactococcus]KAF6611331.1 PTS mannose/fructose/sorbose transporter subunit IIC [Lactococcus sp. EKM201L]KAF6613785.1 PTS mannose/fructose/sorbose transporter subunit IIC [Lactococcus sp. EKM203L]KAF6642108.1 PTS mannose/fructose/sorbose transporter subunit IIC [Lactococcus sp. EKM501L]KAF6645852.1 PTS mannose/fructose/sorbose transporter subunit IIC [Lactococcus sp. EKM502L]KAF6654344.1 PTS mannose/fructose/sorb
MEYGVLSVILVIVVAFLAGLEGILDQWQFHQPIIACSLIGIVTGHASAGIILGGSLQLIALGWANVGAAVAPDAALASIASSILMVQSNNFDLTHIMGTIVPAAILLATAGLVLTTLVRMLSVVLVHQADRAAENGSYSGVEMWHFIALICQGLRIAIPAGLLLVISPDAIQKTLAAIPPVISGGLAVGGGMVVAVGYAMVINLMATREVWPFFFLGFALAPISELTLIATGVLGVVIAIVYLNLQASGGSGNGTASSSGDPIGDILNDY